MGGSELRGGVDFLFYTPYSMILPMHSRNDDNKRRR